MSLGNVHIVMFHRRPENLSLTHSIKFITITFLKYSFSVPPETKQLSLFNVSMKSMGRHRDVNFKHNTKHITVVLSSILLIKYAA